MHCEERVLARRAGGGSRAASCARRKVLAVWLEFCAECAAARHKSQRGVNGQRGGARLDSLKHALKKDMSQVRMAFSVERAPGRRPRPDALPRRACRRTTRPGAAGGAAGPARADWVALVRSFFCAIRNCGRKYKIEYDLIRLLKPPLLGLAHGSSHTHGSHALASILGRNHVTHDSRLP